MKRRVLFVGLAVTIGVFPACRRKVSASQCDELLDRYADLLVAERFADAGAAAKTEERARLRDDAKHEDVFKNCTSAVQADEHACAMKVRSADAFLKCLD